MRIEAYFQALQSLIDGCPFVDAQQVSFSKRGATLGFLRGDLRMIDGSMLHFREFVDTEADVNRITYAYHFMDRHDRLRFRYDNADHHRDLNLPTHPHHKHLGQENRIIASPAPTLAEVLNEIETLIELP